MSGDNRRAPRQRTYLGARVVQDDGISISCVIRNLSATGALVELPPLTTVPDNWTLIDMKTGTAHRVRVSWRQEARVGVEIEGSCDLTGAVPPELRHVQRLWAVERQISGDPKASQ